MRILMLIVMMAALAACSVGPDIRVDSDPAANLKTSRTFGFYDRAPPAQARYSAIMTQRLKDAMRLTLESHGYTYQEQNPDLWVNFFLQIANVRETSASYYSAWPTYPYDAETRTYHPGTLRIDLVDAKRHALVWQAVAEGRIGEETRANPSSAIDLVVWEMFSGLPQAQTKL